MLNRVDNYTTKDRQTSSGLPAHGPGSLCPIDMCQKCLEADLREEDMD